MYDLIIIGGGPGGIAAGIYAARKKIKTALITKEFGGQSIVSEEIQNWVGEKSISGITLAKKLEEHIRAQEGIDIIEGTLINHIEKQNDGFRVITHEKKEYITKTVLVTSGSRRRRLGVLGEENFEGRGVVFCATCDAPLFRGRKVAVIGSGNSGLEAVVDLFSYADHIYLFLRSEEMRGDAVTQEKIRKSDKVTIIFNTEIKEVLGEIMVTGIKYKDKKSSEEKIIDVGGIFVEIGSQPNSEFVKHLVDCNEYGEIKVDCKTQRTTCTGIWASGDVSDAFYKQNNISAGDSIKAVLNIKEYLTRDIN
ncbi:MAG: FAD-dependent oxidoreductase [bacterium]